MFASYKVDAYMLYIIYSQVNKDGIVVDPKSQYIGTEPWSAIEVILDDTIRL